MCELIRKIKFVLRVFKRADIITINYTTKLYSFVLCPTHLKIYSVIVFYTVYKVYKS